MIPYRIQYLALLVDMDISPTAGTSKYFRASGCSGLITMSF